MAYSFCTFRFIQQHLRIWRREYRINYILSIVRLISIFLLQKYLSYHIFYGLPTLQQEEFIFSLRKSQLKNATKIYPADSKIGPYESGITLYAKIEQKVAPKKIIQAKITLGLRYSLILLSYCIIALFLSIICESEEINTPKMKIREKRNLLFISHHHHNHAGNYDKRTDYHIPFNLLLEEQIAP